MAHYYDNKPSVASKEGHISFEIYGKTITLVTDTGVFSKKRVDEGSFGLLRTILPLPLGDKILDLGCGYGTIGLTIALFHEKARVDLADINTRALALSHKNASNLNVDDRVNIIESNIYQNIINKYDSIVLNPPIRAGKTITYAMYDGAYEHLVDKGSLYVVIRKAQGAVSASQHIKEVFGNVMLLERYKGYYIYQAIKGQQ